MNVQELLFHLSDQGIEVSLDGHTNLRVTGPETALTDDIAEAIKQLKPAIIATMEERLTEWREDTLPDGTIVISRADQPVQKEPLWHEPPRKQRKQRDPRPKHEPGTCPRCGRREFHDVVIHDGRSTRRDCRRCGCFVDFVRWYGTEPGTN